MYGFKRKNYRTSLRIGLPLITELRTAGFQAGVSECSTCRMQMEQGSAMPTIHPVKLLALAYRLMPELRRLAQPAGGEPDSRMRVAVKLFAAARELAGAGEVVDRTAAGATVADVRRALGRAVPQLAPLAAARCWR